MINLVELCADGSEHEKSPCVHGNIVSGHACYCHKENSSAPRKCPIWRNYGLNLEKWHSNGDFNTDNWEGGCKWFKSA